MAGDLDVPFPYKAKYHISMVAGRHFSNCTIMNSHYGGYTLITTGKAPKYACFLPEIEPFGS